MKNKKIVISVIIAVVILALVGTVVAAGLSDNGLTAKNICVLDTEISGKTPEEAIEIITNAYIDTDPVIDVVCGENKAQIKFSDFAQIDTEATAQSVYMADRGNIFKRAFVKLTPFIKRTLPLVVVTNEEMLNEKINEVFSADGITYEEETYEISNDKLTVTAGHSGMEIKIENADKLPELLKEGKSIELVAVSTEKIYEGVDVDALYSKVCTKPVDAYYDKEEGKLVPHIVGYEFDKEEAKSVLSKLGENEKAEITLTVTMPKVLDADITGAMFKDVIASYTTNYNAGDTNRSYNMYLAASKVNGTVLEPGAVFSYNRVVGDRTVAAGYKIAKVYEAGRVVDGLAGGICQVSSTIYNAALYANMDIVERKNHSFPVSYTPMGQDATVAQGFIDFKFKNTFSRPVKITASVSGGVCRVEILGIKEQNIKVEIYNNTISQTPRPVNYEEDPSMEKGVEKVIQSGNDGYTVTTTRKVYVNGKLVKTEKMPTSYYSPLAKIIKRNTAEEPVENPEETTENPEGQENPEATEQPSENPVDVPTDVPVDVPTDVPVDAPADIPADVPSEVVPDGQQTEQSVLQQEETIE